MKQYFFSGLLRTLSLTGGVLLILATDVDAASWQWSAQSGRERVVIDLDAAGQERGTSRTGTTQLDVVLNAPAAGFSSTGNPIPGSMVTGLSAEGANVRLQLRDAAFGYMVSRPNPTRVVVDIFPDPLGTRWRNPGTPAPATAPSRAASALPETPTVGAVPRPSVVTPPAAVGKNGVNSPRTALGKMAEGSRPEEVLAKGKDGSPKNGNGRELRGQPTPTQPTPQRPAPVEQPPNTASDATDGAPLPPSEAQLAALTAQIEKIPTRSSEGPGGELRSPLSNRMPGAVQQPGTVAPPQPVRPAPVPPSVQAPVQEPTPPPARTPRNTGTPAATGKKESGKGTPSAPNTPVSSTPAPRTPANAPVVAPPVVANALAAPQAQAGALAEALPDGGVRGKITSALGNAPRINLGTGNAPPPASGQNGGTPLNAEASPDALRAQLNALSPESTQPETRKPLPPKEIEPAEPPVVIYVDEEGNTVPKPPDSPAMIAEAKKLLDSLQYQPALDLLTQIREHNLSPEQRENVLYMISDATNNLYRDNWLEGYEPIVASTNEAMNYNLRSSRVPEALMRLGMANLNTGNQDEAAGYFGALRNKYPLDPNVPLGYLALGKDQFKKGQYAEAVQTFQTILDEYPESRAVRDGSRFMAEALFKQGHNKRALILVDFVDRRWPRLYLDDPEYLSVVGELQFQEKRLDDALQTYWTYYNLLPENPENHRILLRIGTIYLQKNMLKGSRDVFEELMRKYPKSISAPVALQRMGEEGLYDGNPTLEQLFALFGRPSNTSPEVFYRRIIKDYPDSPEAELSALRLAAWAFWSKETADAMKQAQKFIDEHPVSPYVSRAEDIIRRGFDRDFALAREEENYERILSLWDQYPQVQAAHAEPEDDLRVALAKGLMNRGKEKEGMDLLSVFLDRPRDPNYGEYVYNLFLARALRNEDWNGVLELGEKVANWDLPLPTRMQLDYARAISSENLGFDGKALPLWRKLHDRDDVPLYQKAYATYFMARDAEHRRDLQSAYKLNMDTLKLFTQLEEERSDKADPERIRESLAALMDVTEVANRYAEALDWADKYAVFVPENSPDYAGLRFRVARLHRKMGDLGRWKAILDDIIKREPDSVFGRMAASELRTQEVARDLTRFTPDTPE